MLVVVMSDFKKIKTFPLGHGNILFAFSSECWEHTLATLA